MSITLVQVWGAHNHGQGSPQTISSGASPSPVTAGNTLVIMIGMYKGTGTTLPSLTAVTDDVGDTPVEILTRYALSGGFGNTPSGISMWRVEGAVGGTTTVSATASTSPAMCIIVAEISTCTYTGNSSSAVSSDPGGFGLDHIASGPIATNSGDYVATFGFDTNDSHDWTVSLGTIELTEKDTNAGITLGFADLLSSGGSLNITWTSPLTSFGIPMYAAIASFSAGPTSGNRYRGGII